MKVMMLMEFLFGNRNDCCHDKVPIDTDICYCPDCGELIENQWFITRCTCCGVKMKAMIKNGKVVPQEKFCHNCGEHEFVVERVAKINFIDINYAVLVKTVIPNEHKEFTQSWVDAAKTCYDTPKLLRQFR